MSSIASDIEKELCEHTSNLNAESITNSHFLTVSSLVFDCSKIQ